MNGISNTLKHWLSRLERLRKRNGYGVHSPFAYNFIKGVVYENGRYYAYGELRKRRRKRGKGERCLSGKADKLMFRIANYCRPRSVSLVGAKAALTAEYIAAATRNVPVSIYPKAGQLPTQGLQFVFCAEGEDFLTAYHITAQCADNRTVFASAGIHSSQKNREMWRNVCNDPKAVVTFDLYELGLVFFNTNYNKQNYTVSF